MCVCYCLFKRDSAATTNAITVGVSALSVTLTGRVELASNSANGTSSTIGVKFQGCVFDSTAQVAIHSEGFSRAQLGFVNSQLNSPLLVSLSGVSALSISSGSVFNDSLQVISPQVFLGNVDLNGYSSFTKTGSGVDQSGGPITAHADAHFINTGSGSFYLEGDYGGAFQDVYLVNSGSGSLAFARRGSGSVVQGNFDLTCYSGSMFTGINASTQALAIEGAIRAHCLGGSTTLARTQLGLNGSLAVDTLAGALTLQYFDYNSTSSFDMNTPVGAGRLILNSGCDFVSKVNLIIPRIQLSGVTFHDSLIVTCTTEGLTSSGALNCYGPVVLNAQHSSGNWQLNYAGSPSTYYEDVYFNRFGNGPLSFGYVGKHYLKKDLHLDGSEVVNSNNTYLYFTGETNQHISSTNATTTGILRMYVDKPSGQLELHSDLDLSLDLQLINGNVFVDDSANVKLLSSCTVTGGSDSSYVEGFIAKYGNTAFTFPIGRNGHFKPLGITAPASTTTFKAMYANLDPSEEHAFSSKDSTINEISTNEYWKFERSSGSANVTVSLYRDNMGCSYDTLDNLKITAYNGSSWKDLGQGSTSGNDSIGGITSNGATSVYGMYTLATSDTFNCVPCRADAGEDKVIDGEPGTMIGFDKKEQGLLYYWQPIESIPINGHPIAFVGVDTQLEFTLIVSNYKNCKAWDRVFVTRIPRPLPVLNHGCVVPIRN